MVKLNKIYTKTGDNGTTALVNGKRRSKSDIRVEAYGKVDETNAAIGVARLYTSDKLDTILQNIQNDLFDLGADLATPEEDSKYPALRIVESQILTLEKNIDYINEDLNPLNSFILPAGTKAAAYLHLARTIARGAERAMVALHQHETIGQHALAYINRLSDFLFVAARFANNGGKNDVLWIPAKNR